MRLSTAADRDDGRSRRVIETAYEAGIRVFDTAHSYALDEGDLGHNERLLGAVLGGRDAFIVTKAGLTRPNGDWVPDGRASRIRADVAASADALGRPIDLLLLHAPDPSTAWTTSIRALKRVLDDGLAKAVGLSNVNLARLNQALEIAPISAVQMRLSLFDDEPIRSGVVARCAELGILLMAHTPLGAPKRVPQLQRSEVLRSFAAKYEVTPPMVALAAVLTATPRMSVIPGATRVETVRELARVEHLKLTDDELDQIRGEFPRFEGFTRKRGRAPAPLDGEVVMLMGLPGAGKSTRVAEWEAKGYTRLNRDLDGGTLRGVALKLEEQLQAGKTRWVLDNTYTTRASRASVLDVCQRLGVATRGIWLDISLQQAQINVVLRMLEVHGRLLEPEELRRSKDNSALAPNAQMRLLKELEAPSEDEGFSVLKTVPFVRSPAPAGEGGRFVAVDLVERVLLDERTAVFGWKPNLSDSKIEALSKRVTLLLCRHPDGPPTCWCRPPLPGLLLAHARVANLNLTKSELVGVSAPHETLARALGMKFTRWSPADA